jgi:hypothetical protein
MGPNEVRVSEEGRPLDDARLWRLQEVADAAREVPHELQPERLRGALARLVATAPATPAERPSPRS